MRSWAGSSLTRRVTPTAVQRRVRRSCRQQDQVSCSGLHSESAGLQRVAVAGTELPTIGASWSHQNAECWLVPAVENDSVQKQSTPEQAAVHTAWMLLSATLSCASQTHSPGSGGWWNTGARMGWPCPAPVLPLPPRTPGFREGFGGEAATLWYLLSVGFVVLGIEPGASLCRLKMAAES